jgi:hypothetical protein
MTKKKKSDGLGNIFLNFYNKLQKEIIQKLNCM